MTTALAKWMTLYISITFMFSPLLIWFNSTNKQTVDMVMQQGLKEAAIEGYFTTEIIDRMESRLIDDYGYAPENVISISGTTGKQPRGAYIEGQITIKNTPIFLLNIFDQGASEYTKPGHIMSEAID